LWARERELRLEVGDNSDMVGPPARERERRGAGCVGPTGPERGGRGVFFVFTLAIYFL